MVKLFSAGDPIFMGLLTLILLWLIVVFVKSLKSSGDEKHLSQSIQWLRHIGTLGLVVGVFGQLLGLYGAFSVIEQVQGISPAMLAGGLKTSMITTFYGLLIYITHLVFSMILRKKL